jgi:uncharacterized protein YceK
MRTTATRLAAVLALALGGCGTALNICYWDPEEGGKRVYGGVRADAGAVGDGARLCVTSAGWGDRLRATRAALLAAVDLPLSAVADTLTLPVTFSPILKEEDEPESPVEAAAKKLVDTVTSTPGPP